jgi:hypothetical protein
MSSYSEYLGRLKQRLPVYVDTRPHRDAGHQTEIVKRIAASGNLETAVAKTVCSSVLNAPSTVPASQYVHGGGHNVQDTSDYNAYTAGQAVAQGETPTNRKTSQIQNVCYSSSTVPELNDRLAGNTILANSSVGLIQAEKNKNQRGYNSCASCGAPVRVEFASGCNCKLTTAQRSQLKSAINRIHTVEPNA